jgi:hypothetical protein
MNYFLEVGSDAKTRVPVFINSGSGIQKLIAGINRHTRQHGDCKSMLLFFQNKESIG